jgi:hypothetical protein
MTATILQRIIDALPLMVRDLEVNDPALTLFGDEWSLSLVCPWTLVGEDFSCSWEDEDLEDAAWELVGRRLIGVTAQDNEATDPVFEFDGGITLAVFADTDLDPWTLALPDLVVNGKRA